MDNPGVEIKDAQPMTGRMQAYESFRQQILEARLKPGQFVSQRHLMEILHLPLGAVREVIPRLEAARLLVTVPKRGLQIAHVDFKLIRNAFQIRQMIEKEAVINFVDIVADDELERMETSHRDILARALAPTPDTLLDRDTQKVDWGMHDRMVDCLGNEMLSEIYRVNSLHVRLIKIDAELVRPMRIVPAMEEHLSFIAALKKRDKNAAVSLIAQHVENSRKRVLEGLL
ncbi:GntR family transcriptional regulator [Rhizobium sp.]|uniref:GntR family transcriptional regulator n=1 Tax=Rhizobium sp. TaxID=391 RepID=UPI0034C5BB5B